VAAIRVIVFFLGAWLVGGTLFSAVQTFVLPRSAPDGLTRQVFMAVRRVFAFRLRRASTYAQRDRIMALFAPVSLLALVPTWLALILLGYTAMFWAVGAGSLYQSFRLSGSSLLTLGFANAEGLPVALLEFSEAAMGLILVALLIAYLPTMYSAFSRREAAVTLLEVRAGNPPSASEMILRFHRIHGLDQLGEMWRAWESWFAEVEESHTSLAALVFFRSPRPDHSWVTAAGAILDTAALTLAAVDIPHDFQADLCLRAGYLALRHIAGFFEIPYPPNPEYPREPISIRRAEFEACLESLEARGVPLREDREQAWKDFAGWRVNYDAVLLALAGLTMAPYAPWSSDRIPEKDSDRLPFFAKKIKKHLRKTEKTKHEFSRMGPIDE
jgi:hypothetical protein